MRKIEYPEYFAGSAGVATTEACLAHVENMMKGERARFPFDNFSKYFEVGRYESDNFILVARHPNAELQTFVGTPNFRNYYWAPANRGRVCSLVLMLRIGVMIRHTRVVVVHANGRISSVVNLGCPSPGDRPSDWLKMVLRQYAA